MCPSSDSICVLPPSTISKIAAGEVVDRPASIVKELVENSIDAKATNIRVVVKEAGSMLIQVVDDGAGMSAKDAAICVQKHATSKIYEAEDLYNVHTMGFRGEALFSIASVANLEIKTRRKQDDVGHHLRVSGGKIVDQLPASLATGTVLSVKNLFYNIPVRRKFLKALHVEMRHIVGVFQRIALSHPSLSFSLVDDTNAKKETLYALTAGKLTHRIVELFGKPYKEQLAPVHFANDYLTVQGYLGKPEFAKKRKYEQFIFVNKRFVRSLHISHAIAKAYEKILPQNKHPFCVIFVDISPRLIDVNIHPAKTEVKFENEQLVYKLLYATFLKALSVSNIVHPMDFSTDVNFPTFSRKINHEKTALEKKTDTSLPQKKDKYWKNWENMYKDLQATEPYNMADVASEDKTSVVSEESAATLPIFDEKTYAASDRKHVPFVFQLHQQYILREVPSGLLLVRQRYAHEQVLYERFLKDVRDKGKTNTQQLLFPESFSFPKHHITLLKEVAQEVLALGFDFVFKEDDTVLVRGVPIGIRKVDGKVLFEEFIVQYQENDATLSLGKAENVAAAMARRLRIPEGVILSKEEMLYIVDSLYLCENSNYTPSGESITCIIPPAMLFDMFQRKR